MAETKSNWQMLSDCASDNNKVWESIPLPTVVKFWSTARKNLNCRSKSRPKLRSVASTPFQAVFLNFNYRSQRLAEFISCATTELSSMNDVHVGNINQAAKGTFCAVNRRCYRITPWNFKPQSSHGMARGVYKFISKKNYSLESAESL